MIAFQIYGERHLTSRGSPHLPSSGSWATPSAHSARARCAATRMGPAAPPRSGESTANHKARGALSAQRSALSAQCSARQSVTLNPAQAGSRCRRLTQGWGINEEEGEATDTHLPMQLRSCPCHAQAGSQSPTPKPPTPPPHPPTHPPTRCLRLAPPCKDAAHQLPQVVQDERDLHAAEGPGAPAAAAVGGKQRVREGGRHAVTQPARAGRRWAVRTAGDRGLGLGLGLG